MTAIHIGELLRNLYCAKDSYAEKNTVADIAIPDVKMTDKYADEIYAFYRADILPRMFVISARQTVTQK